MGFRFSLKAAVTSPDSSVHCSGMSVIAPGSSNFCNPARRPWPCNSFKRADTTRGSAHTSSYSLPIKSSKRVSEKNTLKMFFYKKKVFSEISLLICFRISQLKTMETKRTCTFSREMWPTSVTFNLSNGHLPTNAVSLFLSGTTKATT